MFQSKKSNINFVSKKTAQVFLLLLLSVSVGLTTTGCGSDLCKATNSCEPQE